VPGLLGCGRVKGGGEAVLGQTVGGSAFAHLIAEPLKLPDIERRQLLILAGRQDDGDIALLRLDDYRLPLK
jgi:hypothetical protein